MPVFTCGDCSPGGSHPVFNTQKEFNAHRTKAHGETIDEIIEAGAGLAGQLLSRHDDRADIDEFIEEAKRAFSDVSAKIQEQADQIRVLTEVNQTLTARITALETKVQ